MFQQDYLMRLIWQFVEGIRRSFDRGIRDPQDAADSLEDALSQALDIDAGVVLGLAPESFASVLSVSGTDPHIVEYVVRSLALEAHFLEQAGRADMANLRFEQGRALAAAYGIEPPAPGEIPCEADFDAMLAADGIEGD